jgi:hypothetical protein
MGKTIRIYVDESLQQVLERVRIEVANDMKKKYNLDEITIEGTLVSQILSAKLKGQNCLSFNIRKKGLNKGVLELI